MINELTKGLLNDGYKFKEILEKPVLQNRIEPYVFDFLGIPYRYGRYTVSNEEEAAKCIRLERGITRVTGSVLPRCLEGTRLYGNRDAFVDPLVVRQALYVLDNSSIVLRGKDVVDKFAQLIASNYNLYVSERLWREIWDYDAWFGPSQEPLIETAVESRGITKNYKNFSFGEGGTFEYTIIELTRLLLCCAIDDALGFKVFAAAGGKLSEEELAEAKGRTKNWSIDKYVLEKWVNNSKKCISDLVEDVHIPDVNRGVKYKERFFSLIETDGLLRSEKIFEELLADTRPVDMQGGGDKTDWSRAVLRNLAVYEAWRARRDSIKRGENSMFDPYAETRGETDASGEGRLPFVDLRADSGDIVYNWSVPPMGDLYDEFAKINARDTYKIPYVPGGQHMLYDIEATDGTDWYIADVKRLEIPEGTFGCGITVRGKLEELVVPSTVMFMTIGVPLQNDSRGLRKSALKKLEISRVDPPQVFVAGSFAPDIDIVVPPESVEKYKAAPGWSSYAQNIRGAVK